MTLLAIINSIRALTPNADADNFILEAIRRHAIRVRDTRKDQPSYSPTLHKLATLILKELDNAT